MLLFLFEHKLMTQYQLYSFYRLVHPNIIYDSFRHRVDKFIKHDLLQQKKYSLSQKKNGVRQKLLQLTEKGHWFLIEAGYLPRASEFDVMVPGPKWDMTLALKEQILHAINAESSLSGTIVGGKYQNLYLLNHHNNQSEYKKRTIYAEDYPQFSEKVDTYEQEALSASHDHVLHSAEDISYLLPQIKGDLPIKPNWLFKVGNELIVIEIDSGYGKIGAALNKEDIANNNATAETIKEKLIHYASFAYALNQRLNLKVNLLYLYLDDSFPFRRPYGNKIYKVRTFKQNFLNPDNVAHDFLTVPHVFDVYVYSLERGQAIIQSLLKNVHGKGNAQEVISQTISYIQQTLPDSKLLSPITAEELRYSIPFEELGIDSIILYNDTEGLEKALVLFPMTEGRIYTQHELVTLTGQIKANKHRWLLPESTKVLCVYEKEEDMYGDVLANSYIDKDSILLCNLEELSQSSAETLIFYDKHKKEVLEVDGDFGPDEI